MNFLGLAIVECCVNGCGKGPKLLDRAVVVVGVAFPVSDRVCCNVSVSLDEMVRRWYCREDCTKCFLDHGPPWLKC